MCKRRCVTLNNNNNKHNTHNRQTSMLPVGFERTISAGKRPQTYALESTATEIGTVILRNM